MFNQNIIETNETCANILKGLHEQGISVIPLQGKRPLSTIKWKRYQFVQPNITTLNQWMEQPFNSYGIICGRVSQGIIVIDFDCPDLYFQFVSQFTTLANTYTVKTRRGYHLYFKTRFPVSSRHFDNCDIKGDGGYIVGAGSIIDGHEYTIIKNVEVQLLDYKRYTTILDWLTPVQKEQQYLASSISSDNSNLLKQYQRLTPTTGRNNALYTVACQARKQQLSEEQTIKLLSLEYAMTSTTGTHKTETIAQRLKEAINTIKSAYKSSVTISYDSKSLPNSIREKSLQIQQSTIMPRLLDAIKLQKLSSKWVTLSQLITLGKKVHISKRSILRLLTGDLAKVYGQRIFKQIRYRDYIESYVSQGDKREPNSNAGRPIQYIYQIPTDEYLCKIFRVDNSLSDSLRSDDLYSAGAYRRALHRELIVRLSPMIRVDWYANRLGVHRRTIFRYNLQLNVVATPMVVKNVLTLETMQDLPDNCTSEIKGFTPGTWLETVTGKRYPALKSIANNLVAKLQASVKFCKQLPSRYTLSRNIAGDALSVLLPDHLKSRGQLLTHSNIHEILSPDWATKKFDLGGYLAVYNGYEWTFRPPFRAIAYQLMKHYEEGLVYFIKPLKV